MSGTSCGTGAGGDPENEALLLYRRFIEELDERCAELGLRHRERLSCRKGCSFCCTEITVFPIEWYAVRAGLRLAEPQADPRDSGCGSSAREGLVRPSGEHEPPGRDDRCRLLRDGVCSIYPYRPVICRTHGLPLRYLIEEFDETGLPVPSPTPEHMVLTCDLNFTDLDPERLGDLLAPDDTLDMEAVNERLVLLNRLFLATREGSSFRPFQRIALGDAEKPWDVPGRDPPGGS